MYAFFTCTGRIYLVTFIITTTADSPIPVAALCKASVCGRSLVRSVVSNTAVCLLVSVVRRRLCDGLNTRPEESYLVWCA